MNEVERYQESIRILLQGITGCNKAEVSRQTGINQVTISYFLANKHKVNEETIEKLATYVWRKMNSHLLIGPEDL